MCVCVVVYFNLLINGKIRVTKRIFEWVLLCVYQIDHQLHVYSWQSISCSIWLEERGTAMEKKKFCYYYCCCCCVYVLFLCFVFQRTFATWQLETKQWKEQTTTNFSDLFRLLLILPCAWMWKKRNEGASWWQCSQRQIENNLVVCVCVCNGRERETEREKWKKKEREMVEKLQYFCRMNRDIFKGSTDRTILYKKGYDIENKTTQNKIKYNIFTMYLQ